MRVFMLGWEFPPFISGGLGTACHGLTKALSKKNIEVTFVLPKSVGTDYEAPSHVQLLSPQAPQAAAGDRSPESVASTYRYSRQTEPEFENVTFKAVPSHVPNPYAGSNPKPGAERTGRAPRAAAEAPIGFLGNWTQPTPGHSGNNDGPHFVPGQGLHYGGDLLNETRRYAGLCVDLARGADFDVIHAHDWLTYPAGLAVAAITGKPLVVQVHSTEFDRSGESINYQVYDIERRGCIGAIRVIAVSHLTKSILVRRYAIPESKIDVVYNGVENMHMAPWQPRTAIRKGDKIVLFLGRITMQKGPEYFVQAAKLVADKIPNAKFVMAGSGDMAPDVVELAAEVGLGDRLIFTGFLRGPDVDKVFKMADVYVMPSVSEPFGIAALEAISHDVPVILSKTSGASEVLTHALKVDFWDTNEIANKIVAVLKHPPLSSTLREQADFEVRQLTWDGAAEKCAQTYRRAVETMPV